MEERKQLETEIERALRTRGWWSRAPITGARPLPARLEEIAVAWIDGKVGDPSREPRHAQEPRGGNEAVLHRPAGALADRARRGGPSSAVDEAAAVAVAPRWREAHADTTACQTFRLVWDMGTRAAESGRFEIPRPPLRADRIPPPPVPTAPEVVPTFVACDAVIRRIAQPVSRALARITRYTASGWSRRFTSTARTSTSTGSRWSVTAPVDRARPRR